MKFHRASGLLLHPTSLPGGCGIGVLGPAAYSFVDFLQAASQKVWQVLPLNPTGYGDSPFRRMKSAKRGIGDNVKEIYQAIATIWSVSSSHLSYHPSPANLAAKTRTPSACCVARLDFTEGVKTARRKLFVSTKFVTTFPAKNGISANSPVAGQVGLMGVGCP